jgi:hypothetical protein
MNLKRSLFVASTLALLSACTQTTVVRQYPPPAPEISYGYVEKAGLIRSPFSNFTVRSEGKSRGQVVYDANNGKPFRIP